MFYLFLFSFSMKYNIICLLTPHMYHTAHLNAFVFHCYYFMIIDIIQSHIYLVRPLFGTQNSKFDKISGPFRISTQYDWVKLWLLLHSVTYLCIINVKWNAFFFFSLLSFPNVSFLLNFGARTIWRRTDIACRMKSIGHRHPITVTITMMLSRCVAV